MSRKASDMSDAISIELLHSAMSLMETIAESLPDDDVNAIMLSVMAGNIRSVLAKLGDQP